MVFDLAQGAALLAAWNRDLERAGANAAPPAGRCAQCGITARVTSSCKCVVLQVRELLQQRVPADAVEERPQEAVPLRRKVARGDRSA